MAALSLAKRKFAKLRLAVVSEGEWSSLLLLFLIEEFSKVNLLIGIRLGRLLVFDHLEKLLLSLPSVLVYYDPAWREQIVPLLQLWTNRSIRSRNICNLLPIGQPERTGHSESSG